MNKYYRVEIIYTASLGMVSSNTYTHYADTKPENTTEHKPFQDIHKAYFEDPVDAEDYKNKTIKDIIRSYQDCIERKGSDINEYTCRNHGRRNETKKGRHIICNQE